jgi:uncharacterized membrane protein required for colicin V production
MRHLPYRPVAVFFSFLLLFMAGYVGFRLLGMLFKNLFRVTLLGGVDRILGGIFGFIKGNLFIYLFILILSFFLPPVTPFLAKSRLAPVVTRITEKGIFPLVPAQLKERLEGQTGKFFNFRGDKEKPPQKGGESDGIPPGKKIEL